MLEGCQIDLLDVKELRSSDRLGRRELGILKTTNAVFFSGGNFFGFRVKKFIINSKVC